MNFAKLFDRKTCSFFNREFFALNELDKKLEHFIRYRNGFFVEVGANDGVSQSNTLYFEKYKKWSGLLIEPIPELAEKCRENRPKCIVESCALVSSDYQNKNIEIQYANLMSVVKGGMKDPAEERAHIKKGLEVQFIPSSYVVSVPARTLSSVLEQHGIKRVDLLSLDVEGYELEVLKGINFNIHRPQYMLIEARDRDNIESFIESLYLVVAELSIHDVLYRLREPAVSKRR